MSKRQHALPQPVRPTSRRSLSVMFSSVNIRQKLWPISPRLTARQDGREATPPFSSITAHKPQAAPRDQTARLGPWLRLSIGSYGNGRLSPFCLIG